MDLDPVAIACLEKLVASARKLVGVDKEGDLLREVAGWDSSKVSGGRGARVRRSSQWQWSDHVCGWLVFMD